MSFKVVTRLNLTSLKMHVTIAFTTVIKLLILFWIKHYFDEMVEIQQ